MFFDVHSKAAKPFRWKDRSRGFDFSSLGIFLLRKESFLCREVKEIQGFSLIVDPHALKLIAINSFPAHQLIELCGEGPA